MPHSYAGSRSYPATISVPDDGDSKSASTVGTPLEQLANRTAALSKARVDGADADTTYQPDAGTKFVRVASLTADRIYTLGTTGAVNGDEIEVYLDPAVTKKITVKANGGTTIAVLGGDVTAGVAVREARGARFIWNAGTSAWEKLPTNEAGVRAQFFEGVAGAYTFVTPRDVRKLFGFIVGGGGGGGGGAGGITASVLQPGGGGGGGGGSMCTWFEMDVTPETSYTLTLGAGGAGGAGGAVNSDGGAGGDGGTSTIALTSAPAVALVAQAGGMGGSAGLKGFTSPSGAVRVATGGGPMQKLANGSIAKYRTRTQGDPYLPCHGGIGYGLDNNVGPFTLIGGPDLNGCHWRNIAGGAGGGRGANVGSGGSASGGGGPAGGGGSSGYPNSTPGDGGSGSAGTAGAPVAAPGEGGEGSLGCGGGGGGGAGGSDASGNLHAGAAGGNGGAGAITLFWIK